MDFSLLFSTQGIVSLLTLTLMEVVLGIDNIVFLSIIAGKLPKNLQAKARNYGLTLALIPRVVLLLFISWIISLTNPLFTLDFIEIDDKPLSITVKGLILIVGGLFLIYKATTEIHHKLEGDDEINGSKPKEVSFAAALFQIVIINVVFSFDSILTAVGLVSVEDFGHTVALIIMIVAVVVSSIIMMVFAGKLSKFVNKHPTVKMLALSFLLMIGLLLVADGLGKHVPKGYLYFAMAFSLTVELLNLRLRKKTAPVHLYDSYEINNLRDTTPNKEK